jgi:hypothetical protein
MKKLLMLGVVAMFVGMMVVGCGPTPTEPKVEPTPTAVPTPTPKTVMYKVTGNVPGQVTLSYYDKNGNHFSGVKASLPWTKSWTILLRFFK